MRLMAAGLIVAAVGLGRIVMADDGRGERVGNRDARSPASRDGCQNLHHQGDHDDRKKFP
jgi:hypothetical protein